MKFRDGVERDPEDYGYLILVQKDLDIISKNRKDNQNYKKSLELVREANQIPKAFIYKIKLKNLNIGEGFYTSEFDYVCMRIE